MLTQAKLTKYRWKILPATAYFVRIRQGDQKKCIFGRFFVDNV